MPKPIDYYSLFTTNQCFVSLSVSLPHSLYDSHTHSPTLSYSSTLTSLSQWLSHSNALFESKAVYNWIRFIFKNLFLFDK